MNKIDKKRFDLLKDYFDEKTKRLFCAAEAQILGRSGVAKVNKATKVAQGTIRQGIKDLQKPDYGDMVDIYEDEIPLFWPCGVTPQNVLRDIKIPFAITHKPGHMFVGDKKDSDYYVG